MNPRNRLQARALLWQALDLLKKEGWCKYSCRSADGRHCALGSLDAVQFRWDNRQYMDLEDRLWYGGLTLAHQVLAETLEELFPDRSQHGNGGYNIPRVNDHPATTQADIELAFEKSALKLDEIVD